MPTRVRARRDHAHGARAAWFALGWCAPGLCTLGLALLPACDRNDENKTEARAGTTATTASGDPRGEGGEAGDVANEKLDPALNSANQALRAGQFAACRQEVQAYLARAGTKAHVAHAEFMIAMSYHQQRLFGEAQPHFARAIELEPSFIPTYYFYGLCLFNLGRLDEAEKSFAKYLKSKPDSADAIFGQGLVALEADRVDDAERSILRAIEVVETKRKQGNASAELKRDAARYQARLSDVYLRRDDLPRARAALDRAIELWPDFFESWSKLHKVLLRLGETAAAEKALAKYQELIDRQSKTKGVPK